MHAADTNCISGNSNPLWPFKDHLFFLYNWDKGIACLSPAAGFSPQGLKAHICYHKEHLTGSPTLCRHRNAKFVVKIRFVNLLSALLLRLVSWESLSTQRNLAHKLHGQVSNTDKTLFLQKHFIWYKRQEFKYTLTKLRNSYQISKL